MSLFTIRSGATAHPEDSVLQFMTDLIASSGVVTKAAGTTHFLVQAQATPDMTVKVKVGRAHIKGYSTNAYPVISDTDTNVGITSNGSGSTRIDAVVLYIDKSASANSDASNVAKLLVVQGTTLAPTDSTIQSTVGASNPFIRLANVTITSGATSIVSGNISDQRVVSRFQLSDLSIQNGSPVWNGWTPIDETLTYVSTDGPTFQVYFSGDVTAKYYAGLKVKFTNNSTTFQGFITSVGSYDSGNNRTPVTIYGGTDYTVANSAITAPYISSVKAPQGFPLDPTKWTVQLKDNGDRTQTSSAAGTFYNMGGLSITIPIGIWNVTAQWAVDGDRTGSITDLDIYTALSTSTSSGSDIDMYARRYLNIAGANGERQLVTPFFFSKTLVLAAKTTYYPVAMCTQILAHLSFNNAATELIINAVCAYL